MGHWAIFTVFVLLQDRFKYQPVINFCTIGRDQLTLPDKGLITCQQFSAVLDRLYGWCLPGPKI
jgi:hypothetical protein